MAHEPTLAQKHSIARLRALWDDGQRGCEIAEMTGMSVKQFSALRRAHNFTKRGNPETPALRWPPQDIVALRRLAETGLATAAIAAQLKRSSSAVKSKAHDEGIKLAGAPPDGRLKIAPWSMRMTAPRVSLGPPARRCQFLRGERPHGGWPADDSAKCGADIVPDKPYCAAHAARCSVKSQPPEGHSHA